jgi:hypothetical protein
MRILAAITCLAVVAVGLAQDRLPQEETKGYAKLCLEQATNLTDLPLKMDVDPDKPCAVRGEGGGAMVIPDKKLSKETLEKAGKDVKSVGQLWLRKWTPVVGGKAIPNDQLGIVTVTIYDKDRPMTLLFLGVRKGKALELVVYTKESEPLMVLPLKEFGSVVELPLELEWKRGEKDGDLLTLNVLGKYQAVVTIARQEK